MTIEFKKSIQTRLAFELTGAQVFQIVADACAAAAGVDLKDHVIDWAAGASIPDFRFDLVKDVDESAQIERTGGFSGAVGCVGQIFDPGLPEVASADLGAKNGTVADKRVLTFKDAPGWSDLSPEVAALVEHLAGLDFGFTAQQGYDITACYSHKRKATEIASMIGAEPDEVSQFWKSMLHPLVLNQKGHVTLEGLAGLRAAWSFLVEAQK